MFTRRGVLTGMGAALALPHGAAHAHDAPRFIADPFALGVASGSPTASAVVLWTRLAPEPLADAGGMDGRAVAVRWLVSTRPDMAFPVASGVAWAVAQRAHSVHVDVRGLAPDTRYWYRFFVGDIASPIGVTRTLPRSPERGRRMRFATVSCQNYAHGYFSAYDTLVEREPDFVVHLGDYIYESDFGVGVRTHGRDRPLTTIDDYRRQHALYKLDPSLARAHAALPFFVTLDNHDATEDGDPRHKARRWAAYRAWAEHMPVRDFLGSRSARITQTIDLGALMRIELMDVRQFRSAQDVCAESAEPHLGFGLYRTQCGTMRDPARTMLGQDQERALIGRLSGAPPIWSVLGSTVPFAPIALADPTGFRVYAASWSGYPAAQARLAAALRASSASVVVLSGDIHSSWAIDLRNRPDDAATTFGTEIVTTSLTSRCPPQLADPLRASVSHNPHVRFHDLARRGFVLHTVDQTQWRADLWFIDAATASNSAARAATTIVISATKAGIADIL